MEKVTTRLAYLVELFSDSPDSDNLVTDFENLLVYGEFSGITRASWNRKLAKVFKHFNKQGSGSWRVFLLGLVKLKYCSKCQEILDISNFSRAIGNKDGLHGHCRYCRSKEPMPSKHKEYKEFYRKENLGKYAAYSAKRRAAIILRTPQWSDLGAIDRVYSNVPEGYEVDHIIPLQGKNVSGLHVPENLQYLTVKDNRSKGNKYAI